MAWLKTAQSLSLRVYNWLAYCGTHFCPLTGVSSIRRLPFNMYLKRNSADFGAGPTFRALQILRNQISIRVPRPIDLIETSTNTYLITFRISGHIAGWCIDLCSDSQTDQMVDDLRDYVKELRSIRNPFAEEYAACGHQGEACFDWRFGLDPTGPFATEVDFSESLRLGIAPDLVHRSDRQIVFTHADRAMKNVMMKNGGITDIIDWEMAGWYPEYWDNTKCHFAMRNHKRWLSIIGRAYGEYPAELEIEIEYQ